MNHIDTLKLALEALACTDSEPGSLAFEREEEAITAIKEALAQPQQEPDNSDDLTIAYMAGVQRGKELASIKE